MNLRNGSIVRITGEIVGTIDRIILPGDIANPNKSGFVFISEKKDSPAWSLGVEVDSIQSIIQF